jgi:hypothetical protein
MSPIFALDGGTIFFAVSILEALKLAGTRGENLRESLERSLVFDEFQY